MTTTEDTAQPRNIEFRVHRGKVSLLTGCVMNVRPYNQMTQETLPVSPEHYLITFSPNPRQSRIDINGRVAWQFTWRHSPDWTVEEFRLDGEDIRIEYRTVYPVMAPTIPPDPLGAFLMLESHSFVCSAVNMRQIQSITLTHNGCADNLAARPPRWDVSLIDGTAYADVTVWRPGIHGVIWTDDLAAAEVQRVMRALAGV